MIQESGQVAASAAHLVAARVAALGYGVDVRGGGGRTFELVVSSDSRSAVLLVVGRRWAARSPTGRDREAVWTWPISKTGLDRAGPDGLFALVETRDWPDLERPGAVGPRIYLVGGDEVREALQDQLSERSVGLRFRFELEQRGRHREHWGLLHDRLGSPQTDSAVLGLVRRAREAARGDAERSTVVDLEQRRGRVRARTDDATWISLPTEP